MSCPIDPAALIARLAALQRIIETARAIAPYRCELELLADQNQASHIQHLLVQAERQAAYMLLRLTDP